MKIKQVLQKFYRVWTEEGIVSAIKRVLHFAGNIEERKMRIEDARRTKRESGEVLFINGYSVESPVRYRVLHQMEQLQIAGYRCNKVFFKDLDERMERNYQIFVFYRCEWTKEIDSFVRLVKNNHKKVAFDVDDLVIDTKYTDQLSFVQKFAPRTRAAFNDSVKKMGEMLALCDVSTTTTITLAEELGRVVPKTYINRNVASKEMVSWAQKAYEKKKSSTHGIKLGYFSGSLTHDEDFKLIRNALEHILDQYQEVSLLLVGELNPDDSLKRYGNRIIRLGLTGWRELPELIAQTDINLAPLEDTIFNRSKSEIKWIEAALVRVPTVASRMGAFEEMILQDKTGILCENTEDSWMEAIQKLIESDELRKKIGNHAYDYVMEHCTTESTAKNYRKLIEKI